MRAQITGYIILNGYKSVNPTKYVYDVECQDDIERHRDTLIKQYGLDKLNVKIRSKNKQNNTKDPEYRILFNLKMLTPLNLLP